jgi:hypothetical protein
VMWNIYAGSVVVDGQEYIQGVPLFSHLMQTPMMELVLHLTSNLRPPSQTVRRAPGFWMPCLWLKRPVEGRKSITTDPAEKQHHNHSGIAGSAVGRFRVHSHLIYCPRVANSVRNAAYWCVRCQIKLIFLAIYTVFGMNLQLTMIS